MDDYYHISLSANDRLYAAFHAQLLFKHSLETGMIPRLNGGVYEHLIGKMCELSFWRYCNYLRTSILHTPFRPQYYEPDPNDDFIIRGRDGRELRVEIKGVKMRPSEIRRKDLFGIIYGDGQIQKAVKDGNSPDIVVNVLTDGNLDTWITGCATWEMVLNGVQTRHTHIPSRLVPITAQLPLKTVC